MAQDKETFKFRTNVVLTHKEGAELKILLAEYKCDNVSQLIKLFLKRRNFDI